MLEEGVGPTMSLANGNDRTGTHLARAGVG